MQRLPAFICGLLLAGIAAAQDADPFQYLEDPADQRTIAFIQEQSAAGRAVLDRSPGRAALLDRIRALATELTRLGVKVLEHDDGLDIEPGRPLPASIETYDDHRIAMSFAIMGLRVPGIRIKEPGCVSKTYPHFFVDLAALG